MDRTDSTSTDRADRIDPLLAVLPFVAFAIYSVALVLLWSSDPRWVFLPVLPFAFMIALTWLAFRGDT